MTILFRDLLTFKALAFYQESCGFNYFLPQNSKLSGTKMSRLVSVVGWKKVAVFRNMTRHVTFHEQQECGYGFPSLCLATCASADVSEWFLSTSGEEHLTKYVLRPLHTGQFDPIIVNLTKKSMARLTRKGITHTRIPLINCYGMYFPITGPIWYWINWPGQGKICLASWKR